MNVLCARGAMLVAMLALGGCLQGTPTSILTPAAQEGAGARSAIDAKALAQGACGGCHSIEQHGLSPDPKATEFARIANRKGLTRASLTAWLREAHNYPSEMDFYLETDEVNQLVRYIMTLKIPDHELPRP